MIALLFATVVFAACPTDKPEFNCVIAPCQARNESCPTGTFCVNDYCGGCNSVCQQQKFEDVEPFLRCLAIGTCGECAKDPGCVWCDRPAFSSGFCSSGTNNSGDGCAYQFETNAVNDAALCPAALACPKHKNCTECVNDSACGWCGASNSCVSLDSPVASCIDTSNNASVVTPSIRNATQCVVSEAKNAEFDCAKEKSCTSCIAKRNAGKPCLWCSLFLSQNGTCTAGVGAKGEKCPNESDRKRSTCAQCPDSNAELCPASASSVSLAYSVVGLVSMLVSYSFFAN